MTPHEARRPTDRRAVLTSSFCSASGCVGVRFEAHGVDVVDTKSDVPALSFTRDEWAAFVAGVKVGEFDVPAD